MPNNSDEYLKFANILADSGGEILRHRFNNPVNTNIKPDASPVTAVDIEVETKIRSLIEENFPDHGIIGEEFGNTRTKSPYQWIIDPIDGTKSFIAGYPLFTTLISLFFNNKPLIGVIDQPILKERWSAVSGKATLFNNLPLPVLTTEKKLAKAIIATTSLTYFSSEELLKFNKLKGKSATAIYGGDAYAYAKLASGKIDIVIDAGLKPYDFCALIPIIEGVGGVISDWEGTPLTLTSSGRVLACKNRMLHSEALELL